MPGLEYPAPDLADAVVRLRAWRDDDLACVRAASATRTSRGGRRCPACSPPSPAASSCSASGLRHDRGEGLSLALADPATDEALGLLVLLVQPQPGVVNVGYWVLPAARGRGLAGAAVRLAAPWVLGLTGAGAVEGVVRVQGWVDPANEARCGS